MADINPDVFSAQAKMLQRDFYGTWGKLNRLVLNHTFDSLGQDKVAAIGRIAARTTVSDFRYVIGALGASTGVKIGYVEVDDVSVNDDDAFATEADTSSATNSDGNAESFKPITFENDVYIIVTQTGAGNADGDDIDMLIDYEYHGGK